MFAWGCCSVCLQTGVFRAGASGALPCLLRGVWGVLQVFLGVWVASGGSGWPGSGCCFRGDWGLSVFAWGCCSASLLPMCSAQRRQGSVSLLLLSWPVGLLPLPLTIYLVTNMKKKNRHPCWPA